MNSSIKKQVFDGAAILAYSGYFLGCPRPCLTRVREVKIAEDDLAAGSIGIISAGDVSIWGVFEKAVSARSASIESTYIDTGLSGIGSWLSIK